MNPNIDAVTQRRGRGNNSLLGGNLRRLCAERRLGEQGGLGGRCAEGLRRSRAGVSTMDERINKIMNEG
jgi:hypothetical protein